VHVPNHSLREMMRSYTCFLHVSKMLTLRYNRANSIEIKKAIIVNIIHNIFNLRDKQLFEILKKSNNVLLTFSFHIRYKHSFLF